MEFTDFETAKAARGLRLVLLGGVPSPWSQAAKGLVTIKGIDCLFVRTSRPGDDVRAWTGVRNAPVAMFDDEPPRAGWAEILALAERLQPEPALLPADPETRARVLGFSHELMGEGGALWCGRLMTIDASLQSEGTRGFPLSAARYLAARYGYAPELIDGARARLIQSLRALGALLERGRSEGGPYYFGPRLTALDVYSACATFLFAPPPQHQCPMHPALRAAFEWLAAEIADVLPAPVLEHRDFMFERHLGLPVEL